MRYKAEHWRELPPDTKEWYETVVSWSGKNRLYSTKEEAEEYVRDRVRKLLAHPTAGPKLNGKKDPNLQVKWDANTQTDFIGESLTYDAILGGLVYTTSIGGEWNYGDAFAVKVLHCKRKA